MEGEQIAKNNEGLKFLGFIWDMKWGRWKKSDLS